jgi:hypothetical protein
MLRFSQGHGSGARQGVWQRIQMEANASGCAVGLSAVGIAVQVPEALIQPC